MKKMMKIWVSILVAVVAMQGQFSLAQKIDNERMIRDIEVAENVLGTLIKHEIPQQRVYFGLNIKGAYQEGYGVTFRLPAEHGVQGIVYLRNELGTRNGGAVSIYSGNGVTIEKHSSVEEENNNDSDNKNDNDNSNKGNKKPVKSYTLTERTKERRKVVNDSLENEYYNQIIRASKDFIIDYGDLMSQLGNGERIVVTNQGENRAWYFKGNKSTHIVVEGVKADVLAFKQGKLTRDQALAKLKVVNAQSVEIKEADLELLASIFNRLYRPDLSKTYFSENDVYYERLKDYGVIYYMQVYSSSENDSKRYYMPTQNMEDVDQESRNKKVTELYPQFEKELKENVLEYGRTLKTLKDEEVLIFKVEITKCKDCGIPSSLELTVKGSVLREFGSGKLDKNAGLAGIAVKKGPAQ
jgi:hypothetical protein